MVTEKQIQTAVTTLKKYDSQLKTLAASSEKSRVKAENAKREFEAKYKKLLAFGEKYEKFTSGLRSHGIYQTVLKRL